MQVATLSLRAPVVAAAFDSVRKGRRSAGA